VIEIAIRALPHTYRNVPAGDGDSVLIEITGASGGAWTLVREGDRWQLTEGEPPTPGTRVRLSDDVAWKLLFNALRGEAEIASAVLIDGRRELAEPLLRTRSIVV
jgi:hypothetical protein